MKKSLFLLPLLGGFVLAGCKITIGAKTFYLFEKKPEEQNQDDSGNEKGSGGGGSQGGTTEGVLETVSTLKKAETSYDEETIVFSKNGYSVTVTKGSGTRTIKEAYDAGKDNQAFRLYQGFLVTLSAPKEFSAFKTKGYIGHFDDGDKDYNLTQCEGATVDYDGKEYSVAKLDAKSATFSFNAGAQLRLDYFAFIE